MKIINYSQNLVIWSSLIVLFVGILGYTFGSTHNTKPLLLTEQSRSLTSVLNPLGIVKTARRLVNNGVHIFRESLQEGAKVAQMLKADIGEGVSHIVSKVQTPSSNEARDDRWMTREGGVLGGIFRFMGVDTSSLGMVVLNMLIFFAEMITANMLGKDGNNAADTRMLTENLMEWILKGKNEKVEQILKDAKDTSLPESIISILQNKTGNQTACVQLLICKMSPFIWGVQKTVDDTLSPLLQNGTGFNTRSFMDVDVWNNLFQIFPDKSKFVLFGDNCEKRFRNCKLLKFSKKENFEKKNT